MDIRKSGTYKGVKYNIYYDRDSENPRHDCANISMFACWHRILKLGDNITETFEEVEAIVKSSECLAFKKLYMYDHGGIVLATKPFSSRFDSGQVGYAYITKMMLDDAGIAGYDVEGFLDDIIDNELEMYNSYLQGEVYGYSIFPEDGEEESCWGYIGSDLERSGIMTDMRGAIDEYVGVPKTVMYFDMSESDVELSSRPVSVKAYISIDNQTEGVDILATSSENPTGVSLQLVHAQDYAEYYEELTGRKVTINKCEIDNGKVIIYTGKDYRKVNV